MKTLLLFVALVVVMVFGFLFFYELITGKSWIKK